MLAMVFKLVWLVTVGLGLWAFIDCLIRPAQAFPAVGRQTKAAWLIFTALALVIIGFFGAISLFGLLAVVLAVYYLVDVRAKVREITRARY